LDIPRILEPKIWSILAKNLPSTEKITSLLTVRKKSN
jgi:hypothetical protein